MSNVKEVRKLLALAEKYKLDGREILNRYKPKQLAKIYNGIGPDSFPEWLREVITDLHPSLAVVAFIHDVEWYESDGSQERFTESNDRFRRNGFRVAKAEYAWWNIIRYFVMFDARKFAWACQTFGFDDWVGDKDSSPGKVTSGSGKVKAIITALFIIVGLMSGGCLSRTSYFEPNDKTMTKGADNLIRGAVKEEGQFPWFSDAPGKSFANPSFSFIGK